MEQHIPGIVLKDGLTQPVFDYNRCLFATVYVEMPSIQTESADVI